MRTGTPIEGETLKEFIAQRGGVEGILLASLKKAEEAERYEECAQLKSFIESIKNGTMTAEITQTGLVLTPVKKA